MNRTVHRLLGLLAALLMLWLGGTGTLVQILDLNSIFKDAPPGDATQLSIVEGMYGPGNYPVIQVSDFDAAALPTQFDIMQGVRTVLTASHAQRDKQDATLNPMAWVEVRMVNGKPTGQVMLGTQLQAYDAVSGQQIAAVPPTLIPQGGRLPPSLRQKVKTLHRFWNRGDTPGVYFEFLSGIVLLTLLITGLIMYFKLLKARYKIKRRQLFWLAGGKLRGLHRSISVLAAVFLLCMAFTGAWIGFESSVSALRRPEGGPPPPGQGPGRRNPIDFIIPLRDAEVQDMAATTLESMRKLHADTPIKALRLRIYGQMKQGVVISGGPHTDQWVFNADSGRPASLSEPSYPASGFPFGVQVHENIKHFHSGDMFGLTTRLMNLFGGLSLLFLAISGLVMYFDMWAQRRKSGRNNLLWK